MANNRRYKGSGSVTKHGDKYLGRYWANLSDGTRKRLSFYSKTRKEAEKELRRRLKALDDGEMVYLEKYTVNDYYTNVWRPIRDQNLEGTTIETYERTFRLHVSPLIGSKKLAMMTVDVVEMFIKDLSEQTSARQCAAAKKVLSPMFDYATGRKVMPNNPFRNMNKNIMPKYEAEEREIWEQDSLQNFLEVAEHSKYYPIYMLSAKYGLRRGEALGLMAKNVKLKNGEKDSNGHENWGTLEIRQQVVAVKNRPVIKGLKTKSSRRDLPLTKTMHDLLQPYVVQRKKQEDLLFCTSSNSPIAPRNLERDYYKLIEKANVEQLPFHSLRHTACTMLLKNGVPVKVVQTILGHKDISTTLQFYTHCNMDDKRSAMSMLPTLV